MTLTVINQVFADLSDADKSRVSNNGSGKEEANYLLVSHNGEPIRLYSDAIWAEDATFSRDLKWVKSMILLAYKLGLEDRS